MDKRMRNAIAEVMAAVLFPAGAEQPVGRLIEPMRPDYFAITWDFEDSSSLCFLVSHFQPGIFGPSFLSVEVDTAWVSMEQERDYVTRTQNAIQVFA